MGSALKTSKDEVLLEVRIDSVLAFKEHITNVCSKATEKLYALTMTSKYMNIQKNRILMKCQDLQSIFSALCVKDNWFTIH